MAHHRPREPGERPRRARADARGAGLADAPRRLIVERLAVAVPEPRVVVAREAVQERVERLPLVGVERREEVVVDRGLERA